MIEDTATDDIGLPNSPLNLSARMRELRTQRGLKQSEIARRMGLDPSIPSLWEQGKRPVPATRVSALAKALEVSLDELLQGVPTPVREPELVGGGADSTRSIHLIPPPPPIRQPHLSGRVPLFTLIQRPEDTGEAEAARTELKAEEMAVRAFVPAPRPELVGTIPQGWEPSDRIQDISPSLPEGYWLDPVRMEKRPFKALLRARLCPADQELVDGQEVPGAALAERIYQHCSKEPHFAEGRLVLMEAIFRAVLASNYGGLPTDTLVETLQNRPGVTISITPALLRRMADTARGYPLQWVEPAIFTSGGRR